MADEESLKKLKDLPGNVSEHIRQAIVDYLEKIGYTSRSLSGVKKEGDTK